MRRYTLVLSAFVLLTVQSLWAAKYTIDPVHSDVSFRIRHMVVSKVRGQFDKFTGDFTYDEKNPASWQAGATIDAASINTSNPSRDAHLKSPDFFDTAKFPNITFKSTKVTDVKDGTAKLQGLLNLHGVEKPVVLDLEIGGVVKDPQGNSRAGFMATGKINRKDFGIVWNKILETGGMALGEEVEITINIEGVAQQEKPATPAAK